MCDPIPNDLGRNQESVHESRRAGLVGLIAIMAVIGLVGFWTRTQYRDIHGGGHEYRAWSQKHYFGGPTRHYVDWSERLDAGLSYDYLVYPPGYPLFLAAQRRLGITDLQTQRLFQAWVDCWSIVAIYLLARWSGMPSWLGLLGGGVYAVYPMWAIGSTFLLAEGLSPAFMLWSLVLLVFAARRQRAWAWAPAGLLIGVASMFRPDLLLLICPAALWAAWQTCGWLRLRSLACLALGIGAIVGAWGWHNHRVHGVWLFTTIGGGMGLWEGLGEVANPYGFVLDDAKVGRMLLDRGLAPYSLEADRYLKSEYFKAWREHPRFVVTVIGERCQQIIFGAAESWPPETRCKQLQAYPPSKTGILCLLVALVLMRRNPVALFLLALPLCYALLSIGMVHYEPRYIRYTHLSFLFVLLAFLSVIWAWGRQHWPRPAQWLRNGLITGLCLFVARDLYRLAEAGTAARSATDTLAHSVSTQRD